MSYQISYYLFWLSCLDLPNIYKELLEPSLVDRVLIPNYPFNTFYSTYYVREFVKLIKRML